jgi:CotH protein
VVAPPLQLSNHLFDRLMENRDYRQRFARRWKQLRGGEFSVQKIQAMIESNARTIGEAAHRNARRWAGASGYYPDRRSFAEDVSQMKSWIEKRVQWLDAEIQRRARE